MANAKSAAHFISAHVKKVVRRPVESGQSGQSAAVFGLRSRFGGQKQKNECGLCVFCSRCSSWGMPSIRLWWPKPRCACACQVSGCPRLAVCCACRVANLTLVFVLLWFPQADVMAEFDATIRDAQVLLDSASKYVTAIDYCCSASDCPFLH